MSDLTPLPNPSCGAVAPDGDLCPSDSAVIITSEWPTGYATLIWRCPDHIGTSVEAAHQLSPQSVITVTPLTAIDTMEDTTEDTAEHTEEPTPDASAEDRPALRLVR
jgi:hypothetical protein